MKIATETATPAANAHADAIAQTERWVRECRDLLPTVEIADKFLIAFPGWRVTVEVWGGVQVSRLVADLTTLTPELKWLTARLGKYWIDDQAEVQLCSYRFKDFELKAFFDAKGDACQCQFTQTGTKVVSGV